MNSRQTEIPNDVLPQQIVEDENGVMRVVPEEWLEPDTPDRQNPFLQNELAMENMENDMPCADVEGYDTENFDSLDEFRDAME